MDIASHLPISEINVVLRLRNITLPYSLTGKHEEEIEVLNEARFLFAKPLALGDIPLSGLPIGNIEELSCQGSDMCLGLDGEVRIVRLPSGQFGLANMLGHMTYLVLNRLSLRLTAKGEASLYLDFTSSFASSIYSGGFASVAAERASLVSYVNVLGNNEDELLKALTRVNALTHGE